MWPGCEADYSPQTRAEVNNILIHTSTPPYAFMVYRLVSWAQGQLYLLPSFPYVLHASFKSSPSIWPPSIRWWFIVTFRNMSVLLREGRLAAPAPRAVMRRALVWLHASTHTGFRSQPEDAIWWWCHGDPPHIPRVLVASVLLETLRRNLRSHHANGQILLSCFIFIQFSFFYFLILCVSYLFPWRALYLICFCWRGCDEWRLNAGNEAYEILNLHHRMSVVIYNPSWGLVACRRGNVIVPTTLKLWSGIILEL
jgi:hypothetical protein